MSKKTLTGYPSIDKPWLKYYSEESINAPLPEKTIYEYLWEQNKSHLEDTALIYFDRKITYKELFENIDNTAKAFEACGVKSGDVIVMTTVTTPEVIYAFYALNLLGAIANIVDPRTGKDGISDFINEVNAEIVLTIDIAFPKIIKSIENTNVRKLLLVSPADSFPPIKRLFYNVSKGINSKPQLSKNCLKWSDFVALGSGTQYSAVPYKKDTCCAMVHTGGTTGMPKSVMLSNDNLNVMAMQYCLLGVEFNRNQNFLNIMPPFIAYGIVLGIHMPLCLGLNDVIIPQLDPKKFPDSIIKYKPAHLAGVPMHYEQLRSSPKARNLDLSFFQMTGCGGDGMAEGFEEAINQFFREHHCKYPITKGYGMTEISSAATTNKTELNKLGSVGIPHSKTTVSIFEVGTDNELPYGADGEICMHAPTMMLGYYNNPEEEAKVLLKHRDGNLWIHSGDIGHMDEDGFLFINGRLKRMIIRPDGHNVWPSQIENVILRHPNIKECTVVGLSVPGKSNGRIPTAFIVLENTEAASEELKQKIDEFCKERLPERDCALDYRFIDNLPLTPVGKIDYRALERMATASAKTE